MAESDQVITGIALVEVVQIEQKGKGFLDRVFSSGSKEFSVRVQVLEKHGQAEVASELELPATSAHQPRERYLLFLSGDRVIDSDPVREGRVRTINPYDMAALTGALTIRMAADLWIGKKMPMVASKERL
jgi:hypothetical protein